MIEWPCTRPRTGRPAISPPSLLRSGTPTAHERVALPLLPSGPGGVRRFSLRGAQPSTPPHEAHSTRLALRREFDPAGADCGLQGTATSPSSTTTSRGYPMNEMEGLAAGPPNPPGARRAPAKPWRSSKIRMAEGVGFEPTEQGLPKHRI